MHSRFDLSLAEASRDIVLGSLQLRLSFGDLLQLPFVHDRQLFDK
jgi:hypothetical protein